MKKLILISIIFLSLSCSNDSNIERTVKNDITLENKEFSDTNNLSEDINFIELVNEMESFKLYIQETIKNKNLDINNVQIELNSLNNLNLDYKTQTEKINLIFKTDVSEKYLKHIEIFNKNWKHINNKFPKLDIKDLENAYSITLGKVDVGISSGSGSDCGWRYSACIVTAGAAAVICHAGCDTTALATTAGLGIPACVWACGTIQVYASIQCHDTYCK